jgi:hypothetical protein
MSDKTSEKSYVALLGWSLKAIEAWTGLIVVT